MTLIVVYLHDAMGKTLHHANKKNSGHGLICIKSSKCTEAWQRVNSKLQLRYV